MSDIDPLLQTKCELLDIVLHRTQHNKWCIRHADRRMIGMWDSGNWRWHHSTPEAAFEHYVEHGGKGFWR